MKKILVSLLLMGAMAVCASATIYTSSGTATNHTMVAANTAGLILNACIVTSSDTAGNTVTILDGTTIVAAISVATSTTETVNFGTTFGEQFAISGALKLYFRNASAGDRIQCSVTKKKGY